MTKNQAIQLATVNEWEVLTETPIRVICQDHRCGQVVIIKVDHTSREATKSEQMSLLIIE
jgi:hypothetical protein